MEKEIQKTQALESGSGVHVPFLQRSQWLTTSIAAVLTSLLVLTQLSTGISTTTFQLVLVAISIGVLVAIYAAQADGKMKVDWSKGMGILAEARNRIEPHVYKVLNVSTDPVSPVQRKSFLISIVKVLSEIRISTRIAYRVALIQGEKELAADIMVEINEYSDWLGKITALLEQDSTNNQSQE